MNESIKAEMAQQVPFSRRMTLRQIWQKLDRTYPQVNFRNNREKTMKAKI